MPGNMSRLILVKNRDDIFGILSVSVDHRHTASRYHTETRPCLFVSPIVFERMHVGNFFSSKPTCDFLNRPIVVFKYKLLRVTCTNFSYLS